MRDIDLATPTMCAELLQCSLDAEFDEAFDERGTFRTTTSPIVPRPTAQSR
jgi:hypothetical protein